MRPEREGAPEQEKRISRPMPTADERHFRRAAPIDFWPPNTPPESRWDDGIQDRSDNVPPWRLRRRSRWNAEESSGCPKCTSSPRRRRRRRCGF